MKGYNERWCRRIGPILPLSTSIIACKSTRFRRYHAHQPSTHRHLPPSSWPISSWPVRPKMASTVSLLGCTADNGRLDAKYYSPFFLPRQLTEIYHCCAATVFAVAETLLTLFNPSSMGDHVSQTDLKFAENRALRVCGLAWQMKMFPPGQCFCTSGFL